MAVLTGIAQERAATGARPPGPQPSAPPPSPAAPAIHPFTLSYADKDVERTFRQQYVRRLVPLTRFNLILSSLLFAAFSLIEHHLVPDALERTAFLRFGVYIPYNTALLLWSFRPGYQRVLSASLCCGALLAGFATILMSTWATDYGKNVFYMGLMLVCSYTLVLLRLRFVHAAPVTWILVVSYLLVTFHDPAQERAYLMTAPFALISIQIIGTVACYLLERQARTEYLARRTIEQRTAQLDVALDTARAAQLRAEELAGRDPLTELPNRRQFFLIAEKELDRCREQGLQTSIAVVDLDHFKQVNDRHGHLVGDAVLRAAAECVRAALRPGDLVCRYGGEEFVIMFPDVDAAQASVIAERLRRAIEQMQVSNRAERIRITTSIGLAAWPPAESAPLDRLIDQADQALYQAKAAGRNRVMLAVPSVAALPAAPNL